MIKSAVTISAFILLFSLVVDAQPLKGKVSNKTLTDREFNVGDIIKIPEVLYDFDKETVFPKAYDSLTPAIAFLKKWTSLQVEIGVHSDSRGTEVYDLKLTEARAKFVYDYLIRMGVPSNQLTYRGYGKGQLIYSDEEISKVKTKEEQENIQKKNRRTELRVLRIDMKK